VLLPFLSCVASVSLLSGNLQRQSIAESVSGTLQFAEGNFLGLAEAMPEDKYSYIPNVGKFDGVRSFGEVFITSLQMTAILTCGSAC
jgi:hypothetical protein